MRLLCWTTRPIARSDRPALRSISRLRGARGYDSDMPYRQGRTRPWHGPGHFDDPFMMPEPPPLAEGPPQRRPALIAGLIIAGVLVGLWLLTALG